MATTFVLIENKTLGSATASVTFSAIPQTYTDLKLVMSARDGSYADILSSAYLGFNGVLTDRSHRRVFGYGSTAGSGTGTDMGLYNIPGNTAAASTFGNAELYIPNYTSANFKSSSADVVPEQNGTATYMTLISNLWSSTAAITSITITSDGNLAANSTFTLYGIKKD
jgi:hypothetical protein